MINSRNLGFTRARTMLWIIIALLAIAAVLFGYSLYNSSSREGATSSAALEISNSFVSFLGTDEYEKPFALMSPALQQEINGIDSFAVWSDSFIDLPGMETTPYRSDSFEGGGDAEFYYWYSTGESTSLKITVGTIRGDASSDEWYIVNYGVFDK